MEGTPLRDPGHSRASHRLVQIALNWIRFAIQGERVNLHYPLGVGGGTALPQIDRKMSQDGHLEGSQLPALCHIPPSER